MNNHPMKLRFIYFDLGNLLVSFDPTLAFNNVAQLCGVSLDDAKAAIVDTGLQQKYETGFVDDREYYASIVDDLSMTTPVPSRDQLLDAVSDMFQPIDSMRLVMEQIRRQGYSIGLLSNTCRAHWHWIQKQNYEVMSIEFDHVILSYEVKSMKPDSMIFREAQRSCGYQPQEILFLDDRSENVAGARNLGWFAEQCVGGNEAIEALAKHGIETQGLIDKKASRR